MLYDEDTGQATGHVGDVKGGGVTQLAFHPLEENTLFVGSRRSTSIQVFDLRDPSTPVNNLERSASNNQRISFDVDPWGRWLAAGDEVSRAADGTDDLHGLVRMWDISNSEYNVVFEETLYNGKFGLWPQLTLRYCELCAVSPLQASSPDFVRLKVVSAR